MAVQNGARRWRVAIALLGGLALIASACDGGDDGGEIALAVDLNEESTLNSGPDTNTDIAAEADPAPTTSEVVDVTEPAEPVPAETAEPAPAPESEDAAVAEAAEPVEDASARPLSDEVQPKDVQFSGTMPDIPELSPRVLPDYGELPEDPTGLPSNLDDPAEMGQPFLFNGWSSQWEFNLHGVIASTPSFSSDEGSACWLLIGTATPRYNDELASDWIDLPHIAAVHDGGAETDETRSCESEDAAAAGYTDWTSVDAVQGATVDFHVGFLFEEVAAPDVQAIRFGQADDDQATWFTPTILDDYPPISELQGIVLDGAQPLAGTSVVAGLNERWVLTFHGLAVTGISDFAFDDYGPGAVCVVAFGETFPAEVDGSVGFNAPQLGVVADGHVFEDSSWCDTDPFQQAGYTVLPGISSTPGTTAGFYKSFTLPAHLAGSVTNLLVDERGGEAVQIFTADVVDSIPDGPPPPVDPLLPLSSGPLDSQTWAWENLSADLTWDVDLAGIVDLGESSDGGRCVGLIGTMAPDGPSDSAFEAPDLWLIVDGDALGPWDGWCEEETLEAAGYLDANDFDLAAGEAHTFYVTFELPAEPELHPLVVALGDPREDGGAIYLDPVRLDSLPPA